MAKKIKLDFSKVEERSGYNSRQMPEGLYEARVSGVVQQDAQDGTAMLVYALSPTQSRYSTRNFPYYCKLQQNQLWKLRDLFVAAGESIAKKSSVQIDPEKIVGAKVTIEVGDGTGQYGDRSEIISVYPLSAMENLSDDEDDDEDFDEDELEDEELEDEDYDDSDDSDEDSDEDFEDDDEDLDEDEDDEELEDEELEDDDEDEEDEEPEPAPKRKPAKKSAKSASAKRSVKRAR